MEKNETISNKTLGVFLCIIYIPIILFIFFIFGLSKVDAASYFTLYDVNDTNRELVQPYTNGSRYNYVGNLRLPAFNVINDSYDFEEGFVYRLRANININYYVSSNFTNSCSTFGRSAILQINNRNGNTISTLTRLWTLNSCSIVSYGNGWKYEFSYSFDATFEANSSLDNYDRISWSTGLNSPTNSNGTFNVEYELSGFSIFNLGASDDKNTQDTINAINNAIQSQIDNDNKNTQAIIDAITGGSLDDNTPVDDSGINDYEEIEGGLIDEDNLNNINNVEISLDTTTSNFFWNLFTKIINTHTLIYGLIISVLSLGIIKLILNR